MRWFGAENMKRRQGLAAVGVFVLMSATAGTTWAAKPPTMQITERDRPFQVAKTFEVLVPAGSGVPGGEEPSPDGSNWPSVEWQVGDVRFETRFVSMAIDPAAGVFNWALIGPRVVNEGSGPVTVAIEGDLIAYTSEGSASVQNLSTWLGPGESVGGWDLGWWGEVFNTGDWSDPPTPAESATGEVEEIGITAERGVTASGFYTWSFFHTEPDNIGHLVFTLQMRGTTAR